MEVGKRYTFPHDKIIYTCTGRTPLGQPILEYRPKGFGPREFIPSSPQSAKELPGPAKLTISIFRKANDNESTVATSTSADWYRRNSDWVELETFEWVEKI